VWERINVCMIVEWSMEDGITYEIVRDPRDYWKILDVMKDAWSMKDYTEAVPPHMLKAVADNGGFLMIARKGEEIVGFVFGFTGRDERYGFYHYSHMVGVKKAYRGKGIALRLKLEQRKWALSQGFKLIVWTYDPHQGLNARFNFGKLGVINRRFYPDYYGEMRDGINVGVPSDRFKVEWWITSKRVIDRIEGRDLPPMFDDVKDYAFFPVISGLDGDVRVVKNILLNKDKDLVLVEFPGDINFVKKIDIKKAIKWKLDLREVFNFYLFHGYKVVEHISLIENEERRNFYLLWRASLDAILRGEYPWK